MTAKNCPSWLGNAVFYEIYPQSFYDTNGDGIGDIQGIIEKLDYIDYLGCNAIWVNPWYESPFGDAGYDVSDYYKVAPRYGTNDDAKRLFEEAKKRGIRICLDLVPGHTSVEHPWFKESCKAQPNKYSNWYIWTNSVWKKPSEFSIVSGYSERNGNYMTNFFYMQPALNFGFAQPDPEMPWQLPTDHPDVLALREEMKNIMRFWLDMGASGFRADMAPSLVKNDTDHKAVSEFWREVRSMLESEYPEAVLISEWSIPTEAIPAGFHVDFLLCNTMSYLSLFRGDYTWMPWHNGSKMKSYFHSDGKGDINLFLADYLDYYHKTRSQGYISLVTGNHDTPRIRFDHDLDDLAVCFAFLLTMPGVPFIYYGDEIGMDYIKEIVSKEGGYCRTGSRTPMQWSSDKNAGFSSAPADKLYLPVDARPGSPMVEGQFGKSGSLLETVRKLIVLRKEHPALCADGEFEVVLADSYPFVYSRYSESERIIVAVNPSTKACTVDLDVLPDAWTMLADKGASISNKSGKTVLSLDGVSYAVVNTCTV